MVDPDTDIDAFRVRRDSGPDTMEDTSNDTGEIVVLPDSNMVESTDVFSFDAGPVDAGPVPQCPGVRPPEPTIACRTSEDCHAIGMANCRFAYPTGECSIFVVGVVDECDVDDDCAEFARTDAFLAGPEDAASDQDAGPPPDIDGGPTPDAGPPPDLECVVHIPQCPWPERRCLPRCTGATCPDARCDVDGFMCPTNAMCDPASVAADEHGCVPRPCERDEDCECGYCTPFGLCANGAGRCE